MSEISPLGRSIEADIALVFYQIVNHEVIRAIIYAGRPHFFMGCYQGLDDLPKPRVSVKTFRALLLLFPKMENHETVQNYLDRVSDFVIQQLKKTPTYYQPFVQKVLIAAVDVLLEYFPNEISFKPALADLKSSVHSGENHVDPFTSPPEDETFPALQEETAASCKRIIAG